MSIFANNTNVYEIFNMLNNFFEKEVLTWDNYADACIDGANAMVGKTTGVISQIKAMAKYCSNFTAFFIVKH